jgi:hypothetical protein
VESYEPNTHQRIPEAFQYSTARDSYGAKLLISEL